MRQIASNFYNHRAKVAAAAASSSLLLALASDQGWNDTTTSTSTSTSTTTAVEKETTTSSGGCGEKNDDERNRLPTTATSSVLLRKIRNLPMVPSNHPPPVLPQQWYISPLERSLAEGGGGSASFSPVNFVSLRQRKTVAVMARAAKREPITTRFEINPVPIGEGAFGAVYSAVDKRTGDIVAVKKMAKKCTSDSSFQREITALMRIKDNGGHPHICGLRETFEADDGYYYLILDLISGGEMFDHLINNGAYSEADAARVMREVASALIFLHGIGLVHADLKPENLMLSTRSSLDAIVKVVDFGSAEVFSSDDEDLDLEDQYDDRSLTPSYSPPEVLDEGGQGESRPERDLWSLGIILYIMLCGLHPFDLSGKSTDTEVEERIKSRKRPPMGRSRVTKHLSRSALDVIGRLLENDPEKRITAQEMLDHPWVQGKTARKDKIADSAKKLSNFRKYKSKLETQVFTDFVVWADDHTVEKKTSLIERAFRSFDVEKKGYLTASDVSAKCDIDDDTTDKAPLSLSGFSDLLADSMVNKYFPKGHVVYDEGDEGNHMYFINSGTIEVYTKEGSTVTRGSGDFFGEGALLHPKKIRSASIKCITPVHAIQISREYFEKYLRSEDGLKVTMKEKDKSRKRTRAKTILSLQNNLKELQMRKGRALFKKGEEGDALYIIEEGEVEVHVDGRTVFTAGPGDICGEHSLITGRKRNCTAVCASKGCRVHEMKARDFYALLETSPTLKESLREICLRREFQKALCKKTGKSFPSASDLRQVFDAADHGKKGYISFDEVRELLNDLDPSMEEAEIQEVVQSLDLAEKGHVSFKEFQSIFGMGSVQAPTR